MARRFAPSLRRPRGVEEKSLGGPVTFGDLGRGNNYPVSVTRGYGGTQHGHVDRAAGWDMETVVADGYERSVWTYRCIELYSGSQSRLPFAIARDRNKDNQQILTDHPLYQVLNVQANPLETARAFRKRLSAQVLLSKRGAFIEVTKSRMGTITRLDLLDPGRTRPMPSDDGNYLSHFEFNGLDGQTREIEPQRIRWVREPHPLDPFCGTTPLEAAGISIELDHLSRLYNSAFIKNDGRPGGILSVDTDTLSEQEMDRLETRFRGGAHTAGELAIVASGANGLKYVDTTTRPRDMAYSEASSNAKNEILSAFGVGESLLGNAAGRSFDNAEQEEYNFWTKPMPPHLDLISGAFAGDVDKDLEPFLDTSKVEALELSVRRRRAEALTEFNAGLRTIDEYRPLAGLAVFANPQTRALWISPAKAPVPANEADAAILMGGESAGAPAPVDPAAGGGDAAAAVAEAGGAPTGGGDGAAAVAEANGEAPLVPAGPGQDAAAALQEARASQGAEPGTDAADALTAARMLDEPIPAGEAAAAVDDARVLEGKSLDAVEVKATTETDGPGVEHEVSDSRVGVAEAAITAALVALFARQQAVIGKRIDSPKARKGTRFWRPDGAGDTRGGDERLDVARAVDVERWTTEVIETLAPIIQDTASGSGEDLLRVLLGAQALAAAVEAEELPILAAQITRPVSVAAITTGGSAIGAWLQSVVDALAAEEIAANTIEELVTALGDWYGTRGASVARNLARDLAVEVTNGATDAVAAALLPAPGHVSGIARRWVTRQDAQVRPEHAAVEGVTREMGDLFPVGAEQLRYPQDPIGSPAMTRGCRCRLTYKTARGSKFLTPPLETTA